MRRTDNIFIYKKYLPVERLGGGVVALTFEQAGSLVQLSLDLKEPLQYAKELVA